MKKNSSGFPAATIMGERNNGGGLL